MLSDARFETSLPCSDLQRAKSFYADKLGLTPADEGAAGAFYAGRDGTRFILFPSSGGASGSHSQMGFMVADIDSEVRDLSNGVCSSRTMTSPVSTRRRASPTWAGPAPPGSGTARATCWAWSSSPDVMILEAGRHRAGERVCRDGVTRSGQ
jgi:hypothetical protein